ncbi:MAG: adenylosuccinate synthase [Bacteroidales bacterium]|nr:adenylosuccinate synthase [Bacteroidales bacterium]MBR3989914.1 adenylosuccinate synthase [Bacteroidales bacterium]
MEQKKLDVVLGLQWGDEGKGKVVDVLTPSYKVVARFQGGPNAGHSLVFDGDSFVLHTVPSGIFREGTVNVIGNGVVMDPVILMEEISAIEKRGIDVSSKLVISKRAHLILPTHRSLDAASESAMGKAKIGSTLKGIGPAYADKTGRGGLRVGDILQENFLSLYEAHKERHCQLLKQYPPFESPFNFEEYEKQWFQAVEQLRRFPFIDTEVYVNEALEAGTPILAEGAQGSLLDIDFGTYPYVTSSNTLSAGVCTGLGVAPSRVGKVYGIFKAYCTRVGSGPFPTELFDEDGEKLRAIGHEYGATTGRPRRTGWLDMVALKYTVMMNGVTDLIMMKSDVLDTFDTIKVAVAYEENGKTTSRFPYDGGRNATPVYKEFPGWKTPISGLRKFEDFPEAFKEYIAYIESETKCRISIISVGPDRDATVIR